MAKQLFLTPNIAVTGDTTSYMNVLSTDDAGNIQVVTTGGTINTFSPGGSSTSTNWYDTIDVTIPEGGHKYLNHRYYVDADLTIERGTPKTIGDYVFRDDAYLGIKGDLMVTGELIIGGDLEIIREI